MRRCSILFLGCVLPAGCFNPGTVNDTDTNGSSGTSAVEPSSGGLSTTGTPPDTMTDSPTDSGEETTTTMGVDPDSSSGDDATTGPPPMCGDGNADPGELCFGDPPEIYPTGDEPYDLAIADIDSDDVLDILTLSYTNDLLSILESDGIGGFTPPSNYDGGGNPHRVRTADFDGDGDSDIVIAGGQLVTYWNQSGSLVQRIEPGGFGGSFGINSMEVMEGNGDEVPDIVYTQAYDFQFAAGTIVSSRWALINSGSIINAGEGASGIWATEFAWDSDSDADVIGVNQYYSDAFITTGNGDGSFNEVHEHQVCPGRFAGARHVITDDFDGDGSQDIVVTCMDGDFTVSLGTGAMAWNDHTIYSLDGAHRPYAYDIDDDGDPDLLVATSTLNRVALYINDGSGSFTFSELEFLTNGSPYGVEVADLNGDGGPDIITTYQDGTGQVMVWYSNP